MISLITKTFAEHKEVIENSEKKITENLDKVCVAVGECIGRGNKVILFGNGGSAADAQHIAAEFTGRFIKERIALPAIALTTDSSALTAIGNDYGFELVFKRQVDALAKAGDVLIGISTSGNSQNVINAFESGKRNGCINIGLTGNDGGKINSYTDYNIIVPSNTTARIQEMHILIGHIICEYIDSLF